MIIKGKVVKIGEFRNVENKSGEPMRVCTASIVTEGWDYVDGKFVRNNDKDAWYNVTAWNDKADKLISFIQPQTRVFAELNDTPRSHEYNGKTYNDYTLYDIAPIPSLHSDKIDTDKLSSDIDFGESNLPE
jgi:hypothetical protein